MTLTTLGQKYHWYAAAGLLALMFGLGLSSMAGDSAIVDEVAHIPAAYSYLHYGEYRLNPEHPPLIKDLAGLPLQFMHLKFPTDSKAWTTDVNGQWDAGWNFIYHIGNNADAILFWARLPILLLAIVFGAVLYRIIRRRWGRSVALLTLFFYTLSPNILAHSRFVTTDLGATAFIFLGLVAFVRFIELPTWRNWVLLVLALAAANLAKFNGFMLYPLLGLGALVVAWWWQKPQRLATRLKVYLGGFVSAAAASVGIIWLFYIPHVWNMPADVQRRLIDGSLVNGGVFGIGHVLTAMTYWGGGVFKPLVQFLLGLAMVYTRVSGGNVTYFNGQVSNQSFHWYFPELFVVKTQIPLLLLGLIVVMVALLMRYQRARSLKAWLSVRDSVQQHLMEWVLGSFAAFYFAVSVAGNLNLGIRHILPVYVPVFVLVALGTVKLARRLMRTRWQWQTAGALAVLLAWYGGSTLWIHPSYVAYFNELIGGPAQASEYFSDSSVDWGQDLLRLKSYVSEHSEIKHLAVDYFGGGDPRYYFCTKGQAPGDYDCANSVFENWHSDYGRYTGQYIAVSETYLENDRYFAALHGQKGYQYLRAQKPIAKIGYSIYLYKLY